MDVPQLGRLEPYVFGIIWAVPQLKLRRLAEGALPACRVARPPQAPQSRIPATPSRPPPQWVPSLTRPRHGVRPGRHEATATAYWQG